MMDRTRHPCRLRRGTFLLLATTVIGGCGGGGGGPEFGSLSIGVTDTPIDAGISAVVVEFTGVEIKPADGPSEFIPIDSADPDVEDCDGTPCKRIDLLQLQGENSADLVVDEIVPAGRYNWMRLAVNAAKDIEDSYVGFEGGGTAPLYIPSGSQSGLKLVSGFVVPVGGDANFVIDWDLAKAVHAPEGQDPNWYLRPALRVTDRTETGTIVGHVDPALLAENDDAVTPVCDGGDRAYLFTRPADDLLEPADYIDDLDALVDDGRAEVLTTAAVTWDGLAEYADFVIGFVSPGEYTVAFTCDSVSDDAAMDDYPDVPGSDFEFRATAPVTVETSMDADVVLD
jgi:hypothetical protein